MKSFPIKIKFAFVTLLLFCLSSCLSIDYTITIKEDGSEEIKIKMSMVSSIGSEKVSHWKSQLEKAGYKVEQKETKDSIFLDGNKSLAAGKWEVPYPFEMNKNEIKVDQTYSRGLFTKKYSLSASVELDKEKVDNEMGNDDSKSESSSASGDSSSSMEDLGSSVSGAMNSMSSGMGDMDIPVRYHLILPGTIGDNNASKVSGTTLNWTFKLKGGEKINLSASSQITNTMMIGLAAGAGVVAVVLILWLIMRRRKKS